ncbi:MAG: hypothetical protein WBV39_05115 [Rudaea sp.]
MLGDDEYTIESSKPKINGRLDWQSIFNRYLHEYGNARSSDD